MEGFDTLESWLKDPRERLRSDYDKEAWSKSKLNSPDLRSLELEAWHLEQSGRYTEAFCTYGRLLSEQLSKFQPLLYQYPDYTEKYLNRYTAAEMVCVCLQQFPKLSKFSKVRKNICGCILEATKAMIHASPGLDVLLSVRILADWLCSSMESTKYPISDDLYTKLMTWIEKIAGREHIETFRSLDKWGHVCGWGGTKGRARWRQPPKYMFLVTE